ncbi:hypothetical protein [Glaciihabitans sp. UYNi722]|uniref:hypothetical protein n=1 Tax=Glaciihabitans sp. UYNi722 TaxID=3156344 RepID=UPI003397DC4C
MNVIIREAWESLTTRLYCAYHGQDRNRHHNWVLGKADTQARTAATAATPAVIADLYIDANYASVGGVWRITSSKTAGCSAGASFSQSDFGSQSPSSGYYNNRVSSFHTYSGCRTTLYDNSGFGGATCGPAGSSTALGVMNDAANSPKFAQ